MRQAFPVHRRHVTSGRAVLSPRNILRYNDPMEPQISSHSTDVTPRLVEHIVSTPETCGGRPRIAGSRIRVQDIVVWHEVHGLSPDEIVSQFPGLTLADVYDVYAALTYYHDHREEIRQHMRDAEVFVEAFKQRYPTKILDLDAPHGEDNALSP
jgi:uncharacterized protein (DUF433 family)